MDSRIKKRIGIAAEIIMYTVMLIQMLYIFTGNTLHEITGICFFVCIVLHIFIKRKWIKALVTGPNGSSLMTQTNKGWTFDMSSIERTLNEATDDITNLNSDLSATNDILNSTKKLLDDVTKKTAYINFATDDSGNPCIELGKQDNPFKLRITNTSIDFMQGSQKIAYLTNHQLYIESSVITDSILIGQNGTFIWKKRANNHLGLRYT